MSDQMRDKKRTQLQNLKILIVDEYSMVKSDMLYEIDQRLKETMLLQEPFGGIAVVLFGNIFQLAPVGGRYIFESPVSEQWKFGHELQSLWELFVAIILTYNHRQGGEGRFASLLNRISRGIKFKEDILLLKSRVFPEHSPEIPEDTLYVFPRRKTVAEYNIRQVNKLPGDLEVIQSSNIMSTRARYEPRIDNADGKVAGTPLVNVLYLKKNAEVILVHNTDVNDSLNNGAKGTVLDFVRNAN